MNCDICQTLVDDYVDGTLAAHDRAPVEQHLVGCASCRAIAEDFRAIRLAAHGLERHVPSPQAWTNLSAALDAERNRSFVRRIVETAYVGRLFGAGGPSRAGAPFGGGVAWQPLVVAAALVLVVGGTSWMLWRQMAVAPGPARTVTTSAPAPNPELTQSVETELRLAEEHYQKAIAGLEQITRSESAQLDPQVAAVLQKNLEVIDHAIGESRAALETQPTSDVAQESLFEALRNKVMLLQDTVGLINEMRKGNQEGAARIVSGSNQ